MFFLLRFIVLCYICFILWLIYTFLTNNFLNFLIIISFGLQNFFTIFFLHFLKIQNSYLNKNQLIYKLEWYFNI